MSIYKDQEDHLSPLLRRIAAGLTGLQKRAFSDLRKIFWEGYAGKYKSPLFVALATILATLFPVAGAQAQINCVTGTPVTGEVTTVVTGNPTTSSNTIVVNGDQTCIIDSTANIKPLTKEDTTRAVQLGGHNPKVIHRGNIYLRNIRHPQYSGAGAGHSYIAFFITGPGSKVTVDGGTINLPEISSSVFAVQNGANNSVIEFLSGSASLTNTGGRNIFLLGSADNTLTTLVFGGHAAIVGHNPGDHRPAQGPVRSVFFDDDTNADSEVILLPGALIHSGLDSRPLSGVYSRLGASGFDPETDRLKIGNFHASIAPRTGWVHAGQWDFGQHGGGNTGIDELTVDTDPGVRFSVGNGANHHRSGDHELNAIYGADNLRIRSGNVVLGGSVWMPHGKVYIHDAGRLTFEIGKRRDADGTDHPRPRLYPDRIGEMIISRLVAEELIFTGNDPKVFIQFAHYLTSRDIEKFRKQLVTSELEKLDAVREGRTQGGGDEGDGSALSEILKVNKVKYNSNVDLTGALKVFSSGPSADRDVGRINLEEPNKGLFRLINSGAAGNIGKIAQLSGCNSPGEVKDCTGWFHASPSQLYLGKDVDELIVDTNPGARFSNPGGVNHYRSEMTDQNAVYGLETMHIRRGNVVLGGSVYIPDGKVYIHDAGRLTFEIGKRRDADGSPERIGEMIISRLVADEVIFTGDDPRVFIQFAHYLSASDIEKFRKQLVTTEFKKLSDRTWVSDGEDNRLSKIFVVNDVFFRDNVNFLTRSAVMKVSSSGPGGNQDVGVIALEDTGGLRKGEFGLNQKEAAAKIGQLRFPPAGTTGTGGGGGTGGTGGGGTGGGGTDGGGTGAGGGGGGGGGGILVIGLLAALMGGVDLDESESELGQYYSFDRKPAKNRRYRSSFFSGLFRSERGMWVRPAQSRFTSFGASYFGAVSHRMSWDLQQSGDYFLRANLTPATSVSPTGWHSSALGDTLSLTGGWQRDDRRVQFGITHGRYDAKAKMYDSATQGNLFGESKFRHTSVHASAVQELSGGPMKVSASAALMAGEVEQAAYDAENAVMRAKVPAYRQSYTGTRLGFSAKSRKWFSLSDGMSVKPHMKITSMRTRASVNDPVWLRQSDKAGVFTFENPTVLQGVPKSLNVVGIGTDVKPSDTRGVWRLGYAGMEVDGEYQHAAVAAYRMRF